MIRKLLTLGVVAAVVATAFGLVSTIKTTPTASASIDGMSLSTSTINFGITNFAVLTIDADPKHVAADANALVDLQVVTPVGTLSGIDATNLIITALTGADASCHGGSNCADAGALAGDGTNNISWGDNTADNIDTVILSAIAPATGPATMTITAVQDTSAKTASLKVRGPADSVVVNIYDGIAPGVAPTTCAGASTNVLNAFGNASGQENAYVCTKVLDANGTAIGSPVVYTTDLPGILSAAAGATGATGAADDTVTLDADGTSAATAGKMTTVTAAAGSKIGTDTIALGGSPSSCTISTDPETVGVGSSAKVKVVVVGSGGFASPDGIVGAVVQTNAGSGANAAILNPAPALNNGEASTDLIAAIPGAIALGATFGSAVCTGTVFATGTVVTPPTGGGGPASVSGFAPGAGQSGLIVFNDLTSVDDAFGLICGSNDVGSTLSMTSATGSTFTYVNGGPLFANNGFLGGIAFDGGSQAGFGVCA